MDIDNARKILSRDHFARLCDIEIVEAARGYCRASMTIDTKHHNAAGVVQGGAVFTLADLAFGVAANSRGQLALAINVNISFLRAKSSGILYATATEVDEPRRIGAYDVLVTDEQEQIIARFNGLVYRKKDHL